jgi:hypothetical protein
MNGQATPVASKGERRRRSPFRPSSSLLPGTILFDALWPSLIAPPVALLGLQMQMLQVFSKSLTNERGSIHLLPLGRNVGAPQERCVENNLYHFHFGLHDRAVFPQSQFEILSVHPGLRVAPSVSDMRLQG